MSDQSFPSGPLLLDQSKAHPGNVDLSIFQPKSKPVGQGTTSSDYLQKTRADNPEPVEGATRPKLQLSRCQFETPPESLVVSEPFEMSCEVQAPEAPPANLRVAFRLFASHENAKGETVQEDLKARWEGFLQAKTGPQTVKAKGTLYRPDVPLGTKLLYKLVAEHPDAADKAESPAVEVVAKIDVWVQPLKLAQFRDGGIVPQLDPEGMFPALMASVIEHANQKNPLGETASVVVQGFAAKGASGTDDVERASMRARMVKALLSRDQGASEWASLAKAHGTPEDVEQILSSLESIYRWSLESDDAKERMAHFQEECNMRFGIGLAEDGILGPKTWGAVHRALVGLIQEEIGEDPTDAPRWTVPRWIGATQGTFGWGAHALEDSGGNAVEICLVHGKNPGVVTPPSGQKPSTAHNVIQKKEAVTKKPLERRASVKPKESRSPASDRSSKKGLDLDKAIAYLDKHALLESEGHCARAVRLALEAGGGDTKGHPVNAKEWGPTLIRMGFEKIPESGYQRQRGDIIVFDGHDANHPGHIQMYDGTHWVSDFKQNAPLWPGKKYREEKTPHWIYRLGS